MQKIVIVYWSRNYYWNEEGECFCDEYSHPRCFHPDNGSGMCVKKDCPRFKMLLPFDGKARCGCGNEGCYFYKDGWVCLECLEVENA